MTQESIRRLNIGAILWVLSVQYYITQFLVAVFFSKYGPYSWRHNTISDLGNTYCGSYGHRLVCSPLYAVMDVSFVVLGITIIGGAALLQKQVMGNLIVKLGFACVALAGVGSILIGLFPENTVAVPHIAGATLAFLVGNSGMILLGLGLRRLPAILRAYTMLSGVVGLTALILFMTQNYESLGIGGMERIVSYPLTVWMIVFGAYLLLSSPIRKTQIG